MSESAPTREPRHESAHEHSAEPMPAGLLNSLRTLLATLLATVRTRGELLQVELEEERLRIAGIVIAAGAGAFFLALTVLMFSFFLMVLFWDTHRVWVAGLLCAVYLVMGIACVSYARQRAQVKSKLFSASLAELAKDSEQLTKS